MRNSSKRHSLPLAVAAIFALTACQTTGGGSAGGDSCSAPGMSPQEHQLCSDNATFNQTIVGGVAEGAALGALLGGVTCAALGGNARTCVASAGAGAVAGGTLGYLDAYNKAKEEQATRQNIRQIDAITQDINQENNRLELALANVRSLVISDIAQLGDIHRQLAAGEISLQQAQAARVRMQNHKNEIDNLITRAHKQASDYTAAAARSNQASPESNAAIRSMQAHLTDLEQQRDALSRAVANS